MHAYHKPLHIKHTKDFESVIYELANTDYLIVGYIASYIMINSKTEVNFSKVQGLSSNKVSLLLKIRFAIICSFHSNFNYSS